MTLAGFPRHFQVSINTTEVLTLNRESANVPHLDDRVDVVAMNSDGHAHQHVLRPLGDLAVDFQQVRPLQCLRQKFSVIKMSLYLSASANFTQELYTLSKTNESFSLVFSFSENLEFQPVHDIWCDRTNNNNNNNNNMLAYKAPVCQRTSEAPTAGIRSKVRLLLKSCRVSMQTFIDWHCTH